MSRQTQTVVVLDTTTQRNKLALGRAIAARRLATGMSQRKFAVVAGIAYSHLRTIEKGDVSPRGVTIERIASALGIPSHALLADADRLALEYSSQADRRIPRHPGFGAT